MKNLHKRISVRSLSENCGLVNTGSRFDKLSLDSPATSLMVDFTRVHAITASETITVNDALELMRVNRIRALMVIDVNGAFAGIITAMDLMGRKPMAYANQAGIPLSEVQVKNVMLPKNRLKAIARADVEKGHKKKNWVPLFRGEEVIEYPADQSTLTKRYTEESVRFIRRNKDKPFFLYLPHTMVHLPLAVSEEFDNPEAHTE